MTEQKEKQIKTKKRVADFGEVFTAEREVKAMCDLVNNETQRLDSRFLEPACGNGNFLIEILDRKLSVAKRYAKKDILQFEFNSFIAVASLYGVELMEDNVSECRERLFKCWYYAYKQFAKKQIKQEVCESIKYVLSKNIICGDALTLKKKDGSPIIFAEWAPYHTGNLIKRRDYRLDVLLSVDKQNKEDLFNSPQLQYNAAAKNSIPTTVKTYPLTNFKEVKKYA